MHQSFSRWIPIPDVKGMYHLDRIERISDGVAFILINRNRDVIRLIWPSIADCRVTDESYREDCWIGDSAAGWSFYVSKDSPELAAFREASRLWPVGTMHFLLIGDEVVDVFAETMPTAERLEKL